MEAKASRITLRARETEQLKLAIEPLEIDQAERIATASPVIAAAIATVIEAQKPHTKSAIRREAREALRELPDRLGPAITRRSRG